MIFSEDTTEKFVLYGKEPEKGIFRFSDEFHLRWLNVEEFDAAIHIGDSDIGDIVMLVTLWWWLISDVGGRIIMLVIFSMY